MLNVLLNNAFVRVFIALYLLMLMSIQQAWADAQMDAAAASVVTEVTSWTSATGFVSLIGQALALAAVIVVGYIWLKATIFSST